MTVDFSLDTKGMKCPMPILKAKMALNDMTTGQILFVEATDASSVADFDAFCKTTGNELISSDTAGEIYTYTIRKK